VETDADRPRGDPSPPAPRRPDLDRVTDPSRPLQRATCLRSLLPGRYARSPSEPSWTRVEKRPWRRQRPQRCDPWGLGAEVAGASQRAYAAAIPDGALVQRRSRTVAPGEPLDPGPDRHAVGRRSGESRSPIPPDRSGRVQVGTRLAFRGLYPYDRRTASGWSARTDPTRYLDHARPAAWRAGRRCENPVAISRWNVDRASRPTTLPPSRSTSAVDRRDCLDPTVDMIVKPTWVRACKRDRRGTTRARRGPHGPRRAADPGRDRQPGPNVVERRPRSDTPAFPRGD
jgi:hypothetical protein